MNCEDCLHYISYIKWENNGYVDVMVVKSYCRIKGILEPDEEKCENYQYQK